MRAVVLLLALALVTGACEAPWSTAPSPPPPPTPAALPAPAPSPAGGAPTFRYGLGEPAAILPGDAVDPSGLVIADAVFDSLTAWAPDGRVLPAAAMEWTHDPAGGPVAWTFRLRPGARFHDGSPVTAGDFVLSWTRAVASGSAGHLLEDVAGYDALRSGASAALEGLTATDDTTLVVRLSRANAEFPAVVGHPSLGPLPQAAFTAAPEAFAEQPVGNGPFRVDAPWSRGEFLRVTRAEEHVGAGEVGEVVFTFRDPESAYLDFQQERLDFAPVPPAQLAAARERYGSAPDGYTGPGVLDGRAPQLYFLGFDLDAAPFDNPAVRRALSLAIDREDLIERTQGGNGDVAGGLVPFAVPDSGRGYCDTCRHDPDLARTLFEEAGVTELELWFNTGGGHERVAAVLRRQLAAVGVTLYDRAVPATDGAGGSSLEPYLEAIRSGEAGLFRFGWALDTPTFDDALTPLLSSAAVNTEGAANYGGYANLEVDAALAAAAADPDPVTRAVAYRRAERRALADQAVVPVMTLRHEAVVSDAFEGFALNPFGLPTLTEIRAVG